MRWHGCAARVVRVVVRVVVWVVVWVVVGVWRGAVGGTYRVVPRRAQPVDSCLLPGPVATATGRDASALIVDP